MDKQKNFKIILEDFCKFIDEQGYKIILKKRKEEEISFKKMKKDRILFQKLRPIMTSLEKLWLLDCQGDYQIYLQRLYRLAKDHKLI